MMALQGTKLSARAVVPAQDQQTIPIGGHDDELAGSFRAGRVLRIHGTFDPSLGLRFLRRFRLARTVEGDGLANERLEGGLVHFFSLVDVDRAA